MRKSIKSSVKHVRSGYLFLGLYLIAKLDYKSRYTNDGDHLHAFDRMYDYFQNRIDDYLKKEAHKEMSLVPFNNALEYFCNRYRVLLGFDQSLDSNPMKDYISYELQQYNDPEYQGDVKTIYFNMILKRIEKLLNPLLDPAIFDFIQLLQINFTLTQSKKIEKQLLTIGRKIATRHIPWRTAQDSTNTKTKWPNSQIYQDQETFLFINDNQHLKYNALEREYKNYKYGKYVISEEDELKDLDWFKEYRYHYYPIYRWFFILLLDKMDWQENEIETIKYWLYLINESLWEMSNLFGNRFPMRPDLGNKTRFIPIRNLNDSFELLGKHNWNNLDKSPKLPF